MTRRSTPPPSMPLGRLLLLAFPRRFREAHGAPMLQNAADVLERERARGVTVTVSWLRLAIDLLSAGMAERFQPTRPLPDSRRAPMLDTLLQDMRFSFRSLTRRPGVTALAVLTLALGIGASAAMFTVLDGVLLKPLPYPDPDRIVSVYTTIPEWRDNEALAASWDRAKWSFGEFEEWNARQSVFEQAALYAASSGNLYGSGPARRIPMGRAGIGLFEMLGAVPLHGRFFRADDAAANPHLAVLSYGFWHSSLGADPAAVGREIDLAGTPHTVVGVLPDGFEVSRVEAEVWIPILDGDPGPFGWSNTGDSDHYLSVLGRLAPGISVEAATEETSRVLASVLDEDHLARHSANLVPRLLDETEDARRPLMLLMGASALLLLVACANVATLLLGRAIDRQQEIAIRGAIGAGTGRLARQLLTESLTLALLGGVAGTITASLGVRAMSALSLPDLPRLDSVAVDPRALAFTVLTALASGLLFGTAPALSLARADLARTLGSARFGSSGGSRLQGAVVIGEVALAVILLVGAGLLVRSFLSLNAVSPGFDPEGVLTVGTSPNPEGFRDAEGGYDHRALTAFYDEILDEIGALPGVTAIARTQVVPFSGGSANNGIVPEGYDPASDPEGFVLGQRRFVTPGYFRAMGIPLIEGRLLTADDNRPEAASVVLVSRTIADRFWPGESALGKELYWWGQLSHVVGVVGDVRDVDLAAEPRLVFYAAPDLFDQPITSLVLRFDGDAAQIAPAVRATISRVAPDLPVTSMTTMSERIASSIASQRYRTRLISLFAVLSAVLALLGLYGVTARSVAARTRELGIRCALGAHRRSLLATVMSTGMRQAAIGVAIGLFASIGLTRLIETFLYGVAPNDPPTLVGIAVLVLGAAAAAALAPALRAARVDPLIAMRGD